MIAITVKLTKAGNRTGPFDIKNVNGKVVASNVSREQLIQGFPILITDLGGETQDNAIVTIVSKGKCKKSITIASQPATVEEIAAIKFVKTNTASVWKHLGNPLIYNTFYGNIEPYVIEYPFSYQMNDEILQNVKDYTKSYKYLEANDGMFFNDTKIETNDYFNKAVLYNGQQSSGVLILEPKPLHNMHDYMKYPIYKADSKVITYTKSDNFYQYNTFWALNKDITKPLFIKSCESLSVDKIVNQTNMDYGKRSFKKAPLRAKELKLRHILDSRSDIHLVSQFILSPSQISYK